MHRPFFVHRLSPHKKRPHALHGAVLVSTDMNGPFSRAVYGEIWLLAAVKPIKEIFKLIGFPLGPTMEA